MVLKLIQIRIWLHVSSHVNYNIVILMNIYFIPALACNPLTTFIVTLNFVRKLKLRASGLQRLNATVPFRLKTINGWNTKYATSTQSYELLFSDQVR